MAREARVRGRVLPLRVRRSHRRQAAPKLELAAVVGVDVDDAKERHADVDATPPPELRRRRRRRRRTVAKLRTHETGFTETRKADFVFPELHPVPADPGQAQEVRDSEGAGLRLRSLGTPPQHRTRW